MSDFNHKRALVFDLRGPLAHYKKIFATTSALSYPLPPKTSLYGLIAAILGLDKQDNAYLNSFPEGACKLGIQLMRPVQTLRMHINLRISFGSRRPKENRKPTLMEFVDRPHYRVFFTHSDGEVYEKLHGLLREGKAVYTPSLGLANLIASVDFVGEGTIAPTQSETVDSVIPKRSLDKLLPSTGGQPNRLMEAGQYAVEMLPSRDVTVRENIILDRNGTPIPARVRNLQQVTFAEKRANVLFF